MSFQRLALAAATALAVGACAATGSQAGDDTTTGQDDHAPESTVQQRQIPPRPDPVEGCTWRLTTSRLTPPRSGCGGCEVNRAYDRRRHNFVPRSYWVCDACRTDADCTLGEARYCRGRKSDSGALCSDNPCGVDEMFDRKTGECREAPLPPSSAR